MKHTKFSIALLITAFLGSTSFAEPLPKAISSAPCLKPPTIDGVFEADEWRDAKVYDFDMEMLSLNPPAKSNRACELRVMNSANALYMAFRVPDLKVNASLDPLDFDLATLAFCRGKELVTGDDRKVIAPGLYVDKHFVVPNKDGDDKKKDGRLLTRPRIGVPARRDSRRARSKCASCRTWCGRSGGGTCQPLETEIERPGKSTGAVSTTSRLATEAQEISEILRQDFQKTSISARKCVR